MSTPDGQKCPLLIQDWTKMSGPDPELHSNTIIADLLRRFLIVTYPARSSSFKYRLIVFSFFVNFAASNLMPGQHWPFLSTQKFVRCEYNNRAPSLIFTSSCTCFNISHFNFRKLGLTNLESFDIINIVNLLSFPPDCDESGFLL